MNTGIEHATCIATARTSRNRAIRAHYLNLAAYWRLAAYGHGSPRNTLMLQSALRPFTSTRCNGQLPR